MARYLIPLSTELRKNRGVEKSVKQWKRVKPEIEVLEKAGFLNLSLYLIKNRVDVIIYQDAKTLFKTFFLAKLLRKKTVLVLRNVYHIKGGIKFRILRFLFERVDHIICISEFIREELTGLSRKSGISVVSNFLDLDKYRPLGLEREKNSVLFVGYLGEEKGIVEYLRASAHLRDFHFYVMGDGPLRDKVRDYDVTDLGWLDEEELIYWYNRVELVVVPTSGGHEGFNRVAMEAMACGANVLVSENVPCPVPEGKYILAKAIECSIKEDAGAEMRRFAEQNFSDRHMQEVERILEEVLTP